MHDPRTLAFEIGGLVRVWHVDPEKGGDDDSCGWAFPRLTLSEIEYATLLITCEYDNIRSFFPDVRMLDAESHVMQIFRLYKAHKRRWWQHPRWHFWHWEVQIPLLLWFKRWAFSRCQHCGGRFAWKEVPIADWGNDGPRWFRNAERIRHQRCDAAYREAVQERIGGTNGRS